MNVAATHRGCNAIRANMAAHGDQKVMIGATPFSINPITQDALASILCDLRHACEAAGLSWREAVASALHTYDVERRG